MNDMRLNTRSSRCRSSLAFLLVLLLMLSGAGCSLIPDDMASTLPSMTSEVTTAAVEKPIVSNPLLITEVMTTNKSTLQTADLNTPDWIEIWNSGASAINLEGYCLSDNLKKPGEWQFPNVTLEPGAYLVIYASGLDATDQSRKAGEIHAKFRLSGSGEDLILTSPTGLVLARLNIPELPADISYGMGPDASSAQSPYYYFGVPTPGSANGGDGKATAAEAVPHPVYPLVVNEYMTSNKTWPDSAGDLPDWVELLNTGTEPVSLLGFWLSDDPDQPDQWLLPDVTIQPGACLVIWLSGHDKAYDPADPTTLQAPFRLGEKDAALLISDARGNLIVRQEIEDLPDNVSCGRKSSEPDTWLYYPQATPGQPNTTTGFAEIAGAVSLKNRGLWINEVMAQSSAVTAKGKVSSPDWIELYNGTAAAIQLNGYGLSDDPDEPFKMALTTQVIQPGQYLVVEPVGFGISTASETVYLTAPDKHLTDQFTTGLLSNGISSGRGNTNGEEPADTRFFYAVPTRGSANAGVGCRGQALTPLIVVHRQTDGSLVNGLYLDEPVQVTLESRQTGTVIHYTLDGSTPDQNSPVYQSPLTVSRNTVVCCLAELPGSLSSPVVSRTLLTDEKHDLPIVSIAIRQAYFTDASIGIWTNYAANLEHMAEISYYEADGTHGVDFTAGIALHGAYSRKEKQKSLELNLRECYGDSQVIYPFFPDNDVAVFKRLILRTSGQDWKFTKLRDAFMSEVIEDDLQLETMDWRSCVLYVNGEYYGLYEIRENIDEYYMAAHYGTDPDNVDIIKGNAIILSGDNTAYKALLNYVKNNDMRTEAAYQHVLSLIDEQSLMDWIIAETFFNNLDSGNKKFWCERKAGAQWRWAFYDLDWAMFPTTYTLNILKNDLLDPAGHGQQNLFNSSLQVKLMENPAFKKMFIERYAELLNTTFRTDRMLGILDSMTEQIRSEMPRQIARWQGPSSMTAWQNNVAALRKIVSEKRARMQVILQETFGLPAQRMHELFPEDY